MPGGITDLQELLRNLTPRLLDGSWVFVTVAGSSDPCPSHLLAEALMMFKEREGVCMLLPENVANDNALAYEGVFKGITLDVHSSLEAIGLTAAVSTRLADAGISANVVAATYHDHVFVGAADVSRALELLEQFGSSQS
eukprot:GSChrysophyteH1.ASY1.ANO1.2426.1 assembled CDS